MHVKLSEGPNEPNTLADLLAQSHSVIDRLTAAGVRVPSGSRLHSYVKAFEAALPHAYSKRPDDLLRVCHRALAELHDFDQIATTLCSAPEIQGWRERVVEALGGGILRTDEKRHIRARDTQFELAVAAFLRRKGCEIEFAEPDIVATAHGVTFAIAAKRPRSRRNLDNVIRDAGNQLLRGGVNGLVAVDTSVIVNPDDNHFITHKLSDDEQVISSQAIELARHIMAVAVKRFGNTHAYGVLTRLALPMWEPRREVPRLHH